MDILPYYSADVYSFAITMLAFAMSDKTLTEWLVKCKELDSARVYNRKPRRTKSLKLSLNKVANQMALLEWRPTKEDLETLNAPPLIIELVLQCWLPDAKARPTFRELYEKLKGNNQSTFSFIN